ncbi:hypothetical protein E4633_02120 [Geomonas terrae]|uniref:Uncharacterized protein n=1 Tax=Geomonas terrae TaxID=2562681 RepID=A0A4S1CKL9_9BACT|nr:MULTISPECIES: hypothetical protein [Geomonas]TGU74288.1 hypothetical protein E4633_02120 [Geomonas terrae]
MEIKNKIWMNGSLEWYAYIDDAEVFLGSREVPTPLEEGDKWTNAYGDVFQVIDGFIVLVERVEPPQRYW